MVGQGQDEQLQRILRRTGSGGLRRDIFPLDLGQDEMEYMQNVYAPTEGLIEARPGYSIVATGITWGPVIALAGYKQDDGSESLLACALGTNANDHLRLYEWDGQAGSFTFVDSLSGYTGIDSKIEMIRVTDQVNGALASKRAMIISTDQPDVDAKFYDGTNVDDCHWGSGSDDLRRAHEYKAGRLLVSGEADQSDMMFHSDVNSCTSTGMSDAAVRQFRMGGGTFSSEIVTAKVFRNRDLIVFMEDAIEAIVMTESNIALPGNNLGVTAGGFPLTTWSRQTIHPLVGCGSWRTVANVGEDLFFMDQDLQIRSLARTINDATRGIRSDPISEPIKDFMARINPAAREHCVATHFDRYYILSVPLDSATFADTVFVLDVAQTTRKGKPVWYGPWTQIQAREFTVMKMDDASTSSDKNPTLYFAHNSTADGGLVMRMFDGTTDNGSNIPIDIQWPRETFGKLELKKQPEFFRYFGQGAAGVTAEIWANEDNAGWESVGFVFTQGDAPALPQDLPFTLGGAGVVTKQWRLSDQLGRLRDVQFRLTATANDALKVVGYGCYGYLDNYEFEAED